MSEEEDGRRRRKDKVCCRRSTLLVVLLALAGTLAASAIIIAFVVILRPARISFSITHTSHSSDTLNLTVAANNTGHQRAAVKYRSVFVDLKDSWDDSGTIYIAHVDNLDMFPTGYLGGAAPASINASLGFPLQNWSENQTVGGGGMLTVLVKVQARFKIWKARTRWYNIQVSCTDVVFPTLSPIPCT